jgi:C-terminal processing protease CtpA/Prc
MVVLVGEELTISPGHGLGVVRTMPEFRDFADGKAPLTTAQRQRIVEQAETVVQDLYVHLLLKRAMHAVDPEQRLRLLGYRLESLTDREFHTELLDTFVSMRDLHTNYLLPQPYAGRLAFLGILIERYTESGTARWMVSKTFDHLVGAATLQPGVEVRHWNGMPIELAVWRNAHREAGSNLPARAARGLESLTLRSLGVSLPPDEDWVDLRYLVDGDAHEVRLPWRVFDTVAEIIGEEPPPTGLVAEMIVPAAHLVGVDIRTELIRRVKKQLFAPAAVKEERRVARSKAAVPRATQDQKAAGIIPTSRPDDLLAKIVTTAHGTFGYIRLFTFHMKDGKIGEFVGEVARLLDEQFPPDGLIIDVRGNGGGYIIAAEFLLQFLTPRRIEPEPTQFVNTPATLDLCTKVADMSPWRDSIVQGIETAAQYSTAIPLSDPSLVNAVGQLYHGPVVLITDALCYSACDMFAAGFADHNIGTILGVDANTGAGGANVLDHDQLLHEWIDGPLRPLPTGARMRVSLRRTLRVGAAAGQPVEDLGVQPDTIHDMTRDDLLHGNQDLLEHAGQILAAGTVRVLDADVTSLDGHNVTLEVTTRAIGSLDVYVDGRPHGPGGIPTQDGTTPVLVRLSPGRRTIRLEGFTGGTLMAARQLTIDVA